MPDGTRNDPYGQFNFNIEIDGKPLGGFSEVSGLSQDSTPIEYREGNEKQGTTRKLPGLIKYDNIVLKRGWTKDKVLWEWRKQVIEGKTDRRWNFREGWPCKWEGPALNGNTSEAAIETLEIAHEGLEMA